MSSPLAMPERNRLRPYGLSVGIAPGTCSTHGIPLASAFDVEGGDSMVWCPACDDEEINFGMSFCGLTPVKEEWTEDV